MKHCRDCHFVETQTDQTNHGQFITMFRCMHPECSDPVNAEPLPCGPARRDASFCGFNAKYYHKKEEPVKASVIQLVPNDL